jgi:hypothetical protein
MSTVVQRSAPASPGWAYAGSGTAEERRRTCTSTWDTLTVPEYARRDRRPAWVGPGWEDQGVAHDPLTAPPARPEEVRYAESLRVPLRWWALATSFEATVFIAFAVALPLLAAAAAAGVLALFSTVWFLRYGRARIVVTDRTFHAGRAHIPVSLLAEPRALSAEETWQAAGPGADARAYLLLRPYARESVMVRLLDPADPAPYWLVSSRRPEQLAGALTDVLRPTAPPASAAEPRRTADPGVSVQGHGAE